YQQARATETSAGPADVHEETPTLTQQQADALGLLAETALHHGIDPALRASGTRSSSMSWAVGPPGRHARFRGNVSAPGVRREPGGDAAHCGWPGRRGRRPYPDHSSRAPARAPPPRQRLPLPGLRPPVRPGPSHSPLGPRRADHALEPGAALSAPPSRGARGGLSGGATARRRAKIPAPGRTVTPRRPVSAQRGARSRPRPASAARGAGASDPRADGDAGLAGGTPERRLGDRRLAPVGGADTE